MAFSYLTTTIKQSFIINVFSSILKSTPVTSIRHFHILMCITVSLCSDWCIIILCFLSLNPVVIIRCIPTMLHVGLVRANKNFLLTCLLNMSRVKLTGQYGQYGQWSVHVWALAAHTSTIPPIYSSC